MMNLISKVRNLVLKIFTGNKLSSPRFSLASAMPVTVGRIVGFHVPISV